MRRTGVQKLAVGTVQFGMPYGVANPRGMVPEEEARLIVDRALENNVNLFDTAPAYEKSEEVLGRLLKGKSNFEIVTKTPVLKSNPSEIGRTFEKSLSRLNRSRVEGLIVHAAGDLMGPEAERVYETLLALKESGKVQKIGASIYEAEQIDQIVSRFSLDLIQLPFSILDQRLLRSGHLQHLKNLGIEIHARSIFLQGLLLMDPRKVPKHLSSIKDHLMKLNIATQERGLTLLQAALGYVLDVPLIDRVLIGICSLPEFNQILAAASVSANHSNKWDFIDGFFMSDVKILNPSLWSKV